MDGIHKYILAPIAIFVGIYLSASFTIFVVARKEWFLVPLSTLGLVVFVRLLIAAVYDYKTDKM